MKTIITELSANNQVTFRYVNRPNCLPGRNLGDNTVVMAENHTSKTFKKCEEINKILRANSSVYLHKNKRYRCVTQTHLSLTPDCMDALTSELDVCVEGWACKLPENIQYVTLVNNNPIVFKEKYFSFAAHKKALLDIIKKSQQAQKRNRCWGKVQTVKSFTRNAKQKILEAGAVVDRSVSSNSRYELTLTVPGSGVDVYDVIARYSGYLVNRLTQVIRRWESKGCNVFWFFVWEHQKRGALHMHWCIAIDSQPMLADYLCRELRAKWFSLLEELSVKTCIDLFAKRGFSGTWRYTPKVWQSNIAVVRKSVAAYFSKYLSKNCETTRYNRERRDEQDRLRKKYPDRVKYAKIISLCPSRYWGCASRVKRLCREYRISIPLRISSRAEGDFVYQTITGWLDNFCCKLTQVSRSFKKADASTGFIYCSGWETKLWFEEGVMPIVLGLFKILRSNEERKTDPLRALLDLSLLLS